MENNKVLKKYFIDVSFCNMLGIYKNQKVENIKYIIYQLTLKASDCEKAVKDSIKSGTKKSFH